MNTTQVKQKIHAFIDNADDRFLRLVYSMIESEESEKDFFSTTDEEMITRAKKSMKSVDEGRIRDIHSFKKDVDNWKKNRAI
jgi:hypothetical protein